MSQDTETPETEAQGALVQQQPGERRPPCQSCAGARHILELMYQAPTRWGRYVRDEGIRIVDIEDDPTVPDDERKWLAFFRNQVPSMLGPSEVIIFVTKRKDEEQEIVVPHERLAALTILASSPGPVLCFCGLECQPGSAVVAPDRQGRLAVYCSPLCHQVQTNPSALSVTTTIFGARPKSDWDGDQEFAAEDQEADAEDWMAELVALVASTGEWDEAAKETLYTLYKDSQGAVTLKMISKEVEVSESTVSLWFKPFRE